jgi:hypothetical protein
MGFVILGGLCRCSNDYLLLPNFNSEIALPLDTDRDLHDRGKFYLLQQIRLALIEGYFANDNILPSFPLRGD